MSKAKKIISVICLLFLMFAVVSCNVGFTPEGGADSITVSQAEAQLTKAADLLDFDTADLLHCSKDITFVTSNALAKNVTYKWEVVEVKNSNGDVVENIYVSETGKVTLPVYGTGAVDVTIKATLTIEYNHTDAGVYKTGSKSVEKEWTFHIEEAAEVKTLKTIIDAEAAKGASFTDTTFSAENCIVVAINLNKGFVIHDGTAGLYVYDSNALANVNVGDKINISGKLGDYYSIFEGEDVSVTVVSSGNPIPEGTDITISQIYETVYTEKAEDKTVKITGSYIFNVYALVQYTDDTFYLADPYTGENMSVYYDSAFNYVTGCESATSLSDVLTPYIGEYVNITVAYYDCKSGLHRVFLAPGEIELASAPTLSDAEKITNVKALLANTQLDYYEGDVLAYPTTFADYDATVVWSCTSDLLDLENNIVKAITSQTSAKLTATITVGTTVDKLDFDITLFPAYVVLHAGTESDPYTPEDLIFLMQGWSDKQYSEATAFVRGTVTSATYSTKYKNWEIYFETVSENVQFELYACTISAEIGAFKADGSDLIGKVITACGYYGYFSGKYELTQINIDNVWNRPYVSSINGNGTEAEPYTVTEAVYEMAAFKNGTISEKEFVVEGVVSSSSYNSKYSSYTLYLEVPTGASYKFQLYSVVLDSSITQDFTAPDALVGYTVKCKGYMTLYVKNDTEYTYEVAYFPDTKSPTGEEVRPVILSAEAPASDADLVAAAKTAVQSMNTTYKGGETVTLLTEKDGVIITWETQSQLFSPSDDKLPDVTKEETIEFTVTLTKGSVTDTVTITLTVKVAVIKSTIAELEKITVATGETTSEVYEFTVVLGEITGAQYGNAKIVGTTLTIYGMYDATGAVRYDALESKPVAGDIVTFQSSINNYKGTVQFKNAKIVSFIHPVDITLADAEAITVETGATTTDYYRLTVVLKAITGAQYGNATIEGSTLTIYGMYDATGKVRYDALESKPEAGATVVIVAQLNNYKGTVQFKNARIISFESSLTDAQKVAAVKEELSITTYVMSNQSITLPTSLKGCTISWATSNASALTAEGVAAVLDADTEVTLTATITCGAESDTKQFAVVVGKSVGTHAGTEADPFTVQEAVAYMANYNDGDTSTDMFTVEGVVVSSTYNSAHSSYTIYLEVPAAATYQFQLYSAVMAATTTGDYSPVNALKGYTVKCTGYFKLYGTVYEIPYMSDKSYSPVLSISASPETSVVVNNLKESLSIDSKVKGGESIKLPTSFGLATVTWASSNTEALSVAGVAGNVSSETTVKMTATITIGSTSTTKEFDVKVMVAKAPVATFTFGTNKTTDIGHSDSNTEKTTYTETSGTYTLTLSGMSKCYPGSYDAKGNATMKLGTSKVCGEFSFTVPSDVTSVTIYVAKYKTNNTVVTINGTDYTLTKASDNGEYDAIIIDTSVNKTVTFACKSGTARCEVNTIEFYK